MRFSRYVVFLILLSDACIDPLAVKIDHTDSSLVVDGLITQNAGPYEVRLFHSFTSNDIYTKTTYESMASVWIIDDTGRSERLTEVSVGKYQTHPSGIRGEIGRSYHVRIVTASGKEYESAPQLMDQPGVITSLEAEFEANAINGDRPKAPHDVFNVYMNAKASSEESNLYRFRWSGVYETFTYPHLKDTIYPRQRNPSPWPRACSGYILGPRGLTQVGECTCCTCWAYDYSSAASVSENRFSQQDTFNKVSLAKIPITETHFFVRYHVTAELLSLSEEGYQFWKLVQAQQQAMGSLFQPNVVRIRGNVHSTSDPDEIVLGFFGVSSVASLGIFIDPEQIPYKVPDAPQIGEDCRMVYSNATTTQPDFW